MLERFLNNINEIELFQPKDNILLAVSGGIDSMVLLHLFEKSEYNFGVIHCNFQLRKEESDEDEKFVKQQVLNKGVPAFFKTFETKEYAKISGISIEMAARELRYEYFEQIRKQHQFHYIATAHHRDDLIETFFLNLSRKTGIKGLTGIKEKTGKLIRPLLFAGREEIENYAAKNYIPFREDSSNTEIIYRRNFLRHKILPLFEEWNPSFKSNTLASISNLRDTEKVYTHFIQLEKEKILTEQYQNWEISIIKLLQTSFPKIVLFEVLAEFGFNAAVAEEVFQSLENELWKQFYSKSHRLAKDREYLFIAEITDEKDKTYYLENDDIELFEPLDINIEKLEIDEFQLIKSRQVACLDLEKLEFPLLIRKWKQGDYFQPLGMQGFKKVSDFFIDEKIPLHEKENTWFLCSGETIVWIMGHRIDNRFKITSQTKKVFKLETKNNR